ncbi:uncharacterized protein LOC135397666 [Ornithodoros turicata]|uniref:uncharacterized protein LOC135397666 n=1 Tax=Ornithodoros turicata TaxID=34597 RepID=UPI003139296B
MTFKLEKEMGKPMSASEKIAFKKFKTHAEFVSHMKSSLVSPLLSTKGSLLHAEVNANVRKCVHAATHRPFQRPNQNLVLLEHGSHKGEQDLSCLPCRDFYLKWVHTPEPFRKKLAQLTACQDSELWNTSRKLRLTSSVIAKVPKRSTTSPDSFLNSVLFPRFSGNRATQHGLRCEHRARAAFEARTGKHVTTCGAVVSETHHFLSASPDGLVGDHSILEIKCPLTENCMELIRTTNYDVKESEEGRYYLAKNGKNGYYFQVQFAMFCTEKSHCYFFVWSAAANVLVDVLYDASFICEHIHRLISFYFHNFLPRLTSAVHEGKLLLSQDYIALKEQQNRLLDN